MIVISLSNQLSQSNNQSAKIYLRSSRGTANVIEVVAWEILRFWFGGICEVFRLTTRAEARHSFIIRASVNVGIFLYHLDMLHEVLEM